MRATFPEPGLHPNSGYRQLVLENALIACPLFSGLRGSDLEMLVKIGWLKSLGPGERLFYEGDVNHGLYVVQSGAVRLFRVNASGHEQVVHIARPGESFGEESLFAQNGHALNAAAVQSSRLVVLPRNEFVAYLRTNPELLLRVVKALSGHVREMIGLLDDLRLKSARARLANWLLARCPDPNSEEPQSIALSIPKRVVASELGMASETFSRTLAEFQSLNLLAVQGRTLVLLSPRQLNRSVADEDNRCDERASFAFGNAHPLRQSIVGR
jgi:CRP/FNR family transcriptional regulator, dissimilatory nitrate respiration regulator